MSVSLALTYVLAFLGALIRMAANIVGALAAHRAGRIPGAATAKGAFLCMVAGGLLGAVGLGAGMSFLLRQQQLSLSPGVMLVFGCVNSFAPQLLGAMGLLLLSAATRDLLRAISAHVVASTPSYPPGQG